MDFVVCLFYCMKPGGCLEFLPFLLYDFRPRGKMILFSLFGYIISRKVGCLGFVVDGVVVIVLGLESF